MWACKIGGSKKITRKQFDERRADKLVADAGRYQKVIRRVRPQLPTRLHLLPKLMPDSRHWEESRTIVTIAGLFADALASKQCNLENFLTSNKNDDFCKTNSFGVGLVNALKSSGQYAAQAIRWMFRRHNLAPASPFGVFCSAACIQFGTSESLDVLESFGFPKFSQTATFIAVLRGREETQFPAFVCEMVGKEEEEDMRRLRQLKRIYRKPPHTTTAQKL